MRLELSDRWVDLQTGRGATTTGEALRVSDGQPLKVLRRLAASPGVTVSVDDLWAALETGTPKPANVKVWISRLRGALEPEVDLRTTASRFVRDGDDGFWLDPRGGQSPWPAFRDGCDLQVARTAAILAPQGGVPREAADQHFAAFRAGGRRILLVSGHRGSGKSTLMSMWARAIGGTTARTAESGGDAAVLLETRPAGLLPALVDAAQPHASWEAWLADGCRLAAAESTRLWVFVDGVDRAEDAERTAWPLVASLAALAANEPALRLVVAARSGTYVMSALSAFSDQIHSATAEGGLVYAIPPLTSRECEAITLSFGKSLRLLAELTDRERACLTSPLRVRRWVELLRSGTQGAWARRAILTDLAEPAAESEALEAFLDGVATAMWRARTPELVLSVAAEDSTLRAGLFARGIFGRLQRDLLQVLPGPSADASDLVRFDHDGRLENRIARHLMEQRRCQDPADLEALWKDTFPPVHHAVPLAVVLSFGGGDPLPWRALVSSRREARLLAESTHVALATLSEEQSQAWLQEALDLGRLGPLFDVLLTFGFLDALLIAVGLEVVAPEQDPHLWLRVARTHRCALATVGRRTEARDVATDIWRRIEAVRPDLASEAYQELAIATYEAKATDRSAIEAGRAWWADHAAGLEDAPFVAFGLALAHAMVKGGEHTEAVDILQVVEGRATLDPRTQAQLRKEQALVLGAAKEPQAAGDRWIEASELWFAAGETGRGAAALNSAAARRVEQGKLPEALALNKRALDLYRDLDDDPGIRTCLGNRGKILRLMKRLDDAEAAHAEHLARASERSVAGGKSYAILGIAEIRMDQERWEEASDLLVLAEADGTRHEPHEERLRALKVRLRGKGR